MKNVLAAIILLLCCSLTAQESNQINPQISASSSNEIVAQVAPDSTSVRTDPRKENQWYVEINRRELFVETGELTFSYVDESPSRDNLYTDISIGSRYAYDAAIGFFHYGNAAIKLSLRGIFGQINGGTIDLGIGKNLINSQVIFVRPMATVSFGALGLKIGDIQNNASYIRVNDTEFYSEKVSVRIRDKFFAATPSLEIGFYTPFLPVHSITFKGGYNFIGAFGTQIKFEGRDAEDELQMELEELSADNVSFNIDQTTTDSLPIKYSGIFFGFSVSF